MTDEAPQREHSLREVFHGLRWIVRAGAAWRLMPHDVPPGYAVYQQSQRWFKAGVFATMVIDRRELLRVAHGRTPQPSAAILDSRTLQSTPESGSCAGFAPAKCRRGSKVPLAVATLGHLLALRVTPANEQDRHQVAELAKHVQEVTGDVVELAFGDQAYTGQPAAQDAAANHMEREVVKLPEAKRGVVLLPRRWGVERRQGWAARVRRLARDYEQVAETLQGLHVVFAMLMLKQLTGLIL
jgi:transposase